MRAGDNGVIYIPSGALPATQLISGFGQFVLSGGPFRGISFPRVDRVVKAPMVRRVINVSGG